MADWIKMRSALLTNPKVIRMARLLAEDRFFMNWWTRGTKLECETSVYEICDVTVVTRVTVGSLLSVWAAVNDCASQDGFVKGITLFEVDEMAGVPGFGNAMETVGWVEETEQGLVFPNFHEHNTVGKERSSGAKTGAQRTREWRERKATVTDGSDVTVTSQRDHREEKNREEKNNSSSLDAMFEEFWTAYPKKVSKAAALKAYRKIKPSESLQAEILAAVSRAKTSVDWSKDDGQFIPYPASWLNARRWEDEAPSQGVGQGRFAGLK